jgi:hypothetical protein
MLDLAVWFCLILFQSKEQIDWLVLVVSLIAFAANLAMEMGHHSHLARAAESSVCSTLLYGAEIGGRFQTAKTRSRAL